jgi:hypothetical protein
MLRDLFNKIDVRRVLVPSAGPSDNTAQVGQIIDGQGAKSITYLIGLGSLADADVTFTVLLEESDASDMTGAVAVADTDLLGTELAAAFRFDDDNEVRKLGYRGIKRYTRLTVTPANNASAAALTSLCVLEMDAQPATTLADD